MKVVFSCEWYVGRNGMPDIKKCKYCIHNYSCKGRKVVRLSNKKIKELIQKNIER